MSSPHFFTNSLSMLGIIPDSKTENAAKDDSNKPTKYAKVCIDRMWSIQASLYSNTKHQNSNN
jgi:hypothetical protein